MYCVQPFTTTNMKFRRFPYIVTVAIFAFLWQGCSLFSKVPPNNVSLSATGEKLYKVKCGGCHELYSPDKHDADEWGKWLNAMQVRAKITDYEKNLINDYLRVNAKDSFRYHQ
jgi:mono/diheme cytochrome c family protein